MNSETKEKFQIEYQAGKAAFERGDYRAAVKHLEAASALMSRNSRLGGEAQMWLVTAYEAAGQTSEAIALCEQLARHPDLETSKQGKSLLYILKAPQLKRPEEWMTKIPDLGMIAESDPKDRRGTNPTRKPNTNQLPEPIDPSQINTKDNQFIWVAIIAIRLIVGGLIWFGL
ncbi:MAG: tetratricopeptide repeat protein [Coleofasciculus sp. Co-bin14]|nr:tetratricopeptide repeat protein [Coleofasciculus sp. Co-bin14]